MFDDGKQKVIDMAEDLLIQGIHKEEGWVSITTDIEIFQKIKSLIVQAFEEVLPLSAEPVKVTIGHSIDKIKNSEFIWEYVDFVSFVKFCQIISESLLSSLDDKKIPDYAAPHQAMGFVDEVLHLNDQNIYDKDSLSLMGAAFSFKVNFLTQKFEKIDWKKGWNEKPHS